MDDEAPVPDKSRPVPAKLTMKRKEGVVSEVFHDKRPKFKKQESLISMSGCESIENYKLQVLFIPTGSK
jgi:hypothetical protein